MMRALRTPPTLSVNTTWRELYERGSFAQRELGPDGRLSSAARDRHVHVGIGPGPLEDLDAQRAFRPIAFATAGYWSGMNVPAEDPATMVFSDETEPQPWDRFVWRSDLEPDFDQVSPLYSGWQLLYLDDVWAGASMSVGLQPLLGDERRDAALEMFGEIAKAQRERSRALDEAWRPLMKLLVALQNRFWPQLTGLTRLIAGPDHSYVVAGSASAQLTAAELADQLGVVEAQVIEAYHFLVERGLDREPQDGLTALRRARPRAFHLRWRDSVLRAQDCFDAAELLRRFLMELTGSQPPRVTAWPLDGRQPERALLYDRGPGAPFTAEELKDQLLAAELYPHGVHVIGEGPSERIMVEYLVEALLGPAALNEVAFYDLRGSGNAAQVEPLSEALAGYAVRCLVIVDSEGQMAEYIKIAVAEGKLDAADVLLFDDSLEAANTTPDELIGVAQQMAAALAEPISFDLDAEELRTYHDDRVSRTARHGAPGLADSLITLVRRKTDGRLSIDKLELVEHLATMVVSQIDAAPACGFDQIAAARPIVGFVAHRLIEALNRPRPAGGSL